MPQEHHLDALVVGTGFAGIYVLYTLLREGLTVQAIDKASDVGGTWYWNRYPGALSDTWSYVYRYSFDRDLLLDYPAPKWYSTQPEILEYLRHVVARYDLRRHMQLDTEMEKAKWDDTAKRWKVYCRTGDVFVVRYLVTALGLLNEALVPRIPGMETFKGRVVHTSSWDPETQLEGKRVGVIGVGSSGVQVVTAIADKVKSLHVFIRRPQYSVPANDRVMTKEERTVINERYPEIWADVFSSHIAMGFTESSRKFGAVAPEDRENILETLWNSGNGIQFMFGGFSDITTDPEANEEVCRFIRRKIASIVKDPQKARVLTPKEPYARRPLSDSGYYEKFNRENVYAIDVMEHPITELTPEGIRTADGKLHDLDVLIVATGFDAMDGSYARVNLQGRQEGDNLSDRWRRTGSECYMGCSVSGYPNLLIVSGPMVGFSNVPPLTETNVEFLRDLIRRAEEITKRTGRQCEIEATHEAERWWTEHCDETARKTIFAKAPSWMFGKNVVGKKPTSLFYLGGLGPFRAKLAEVKARGFIGFQEPLGTLGELRSHL
ncbi:flavin-containing monooxygenase [Aspergillus homomorphus CBS 101889]|uniref:Cyclohexanone monooxygenase n=1 Tax=Aspergillus homomorphus (strain CBS 101889) TaxID=1450537 RepID=A0A395I5E0_ASPHC|nr:cyclohexanone monooxygenase [Aspergillus homomorphus CBS 101889]RAL15300.1 cyclohexanone monooxygenase [Aspergillus homomorphus CBS 101889]